ncbi:adenylate/guanylate cyclase domain-containing protein [Taibaiella koreensis]|uniref:adenylate/guanylate cyclase domain-containing protein n=1 Tax=Taibaiella koreensis TaxID=1268548 RepID=UPI000E59AC9A|nr:adenylate/guanylate cyclase domain-containing protein [Taibaiella koreensis]
MNLRYLLLTLTVCLCVTFLHAQHSGLIVTDSNYQQLDLDTPLWRFHAGDDKAWAARDWNDSARRKTSPLIRSEKEARQAGFTGSGWFRLSFQVDSSMVHKPVLLQVFTNGAVDIYLDGRKLYAYGKIAGGEGSEYERPYLPAVLVFSDTGRHVLALRYENLYYKEMLKGWKNNIGGFSLRFTEYYTYFLSQKINILFYSLFLLISGGVFFALFLSHLVMYLFHKDYNANLIFSLFNLGLGLFFIAVYLSGPLGSERAQLVLVPVYIVAPACSFFMLSLLVNRLFSWSKVRIGVSILFLAVVFCITFLTNYHFGLVFLLLQLTYCIVEASILVISALRRKVAGAGILGFGILCSALLFAFITISNTTGWLSLNGTAGIIALVLSMLVVFCLPFSMSAYLSWSFARVNRDLKIQLVRVKELSEKTLEQEQEKQRLLENRQEELEQEVVIRTREVLQQKQRVEQEKKKSDDLLLNILPAEVADELKEYGTTKARHFDQVSVLFTDFVNFTHIAEQLTPEELVRELHDCFRTFDEIIEKHGMEKIKTIGDAYLAVSGMPVADEAHARHAVQAALEIVAFIDGRQGPAPFCLRAGIHSGPLVAGIVGVKKFAYDIWGDTVNMASRMESNSEAGRVNISESTHELVKDDDFIFTYRGKVNAKNKGEVDMYFVQSKQ